MVNIIPQDASSEEFFYVLEFNSSKIYKKYFKAPRAKTYQTNIKQIGNVFLLYMPLYTRLSIF